MASSFSFTNLLDPHVFAVNTGMVFRGMSISENGGSFNIVLRAFGSDGKAYYALGQHEDPLDGLERLYEALGKRGGTNLWRLDKFFSRGG
jgi:hypothetical protein